MTVVSDLIDKYSRALVISYMYIAHIIFGKNVRKPNYECSHGVYHAFHGDVILYKLVWNPPASQGRTFVGVSFAALPSKWVIVRTSKRSQDLFTCNDNLSRCNSQGPLVQADDGACFLVNMKHHRVTMPRLNLLRIN